MFTQVRMFGRENWWSHTDDRWCTEARTSSLMFIDDQLMRGRLVWTPCEQSCSAKNSEDCPTQFREVNRPYWAGGGDVQAREPEFPLHRRRSMFERSTLMSDVKRWRLMSDVHTLKKEERSHTEHGWQAVRSPLGHTTKDLQPEDQNQIEPSSGDLLKTETY